MTTYCLERSQMQPDWWVLTDKRNLIVVRFKEHEFNETQTVSILEDSFLNELSPVEKTMRLALIMRELGDYAAINCNNIIF